MDGSHRIQWAGDSAVVVEFEARIEPAVNDRVVGLAARIAADKVAGIRDIVPGYRALTVHFDPLRTDIPALLDRLARAAVEPPPPDVRSAALVRIPVCYGGEAGPDLPRVAKWSNLSEDDVIARHLAATYRVFMLGFLPGFAYLGPLDRRIAMPRREQPRASVPAGSVGIAEQQTGIYPQESAAGWQIIGRTPVRLVDFATPEPFLLAAGDHVQFYRIEASDLDKTSWDTGAAA
jgi:inhibitor of KinA